MRRKEMSKSKDSKIFKQTANSTKTINLGVITYRGGIRFQLFFFLFNF